MEKYSKISSAGMTADSLISKSITKYDYMDSYRIEFLNDDNLNVDNLVKMFFLDIPKWVKDLLTLRNNIVKIFGLKTGDINDIINEYKEKPILVGEKFALFDVFDKVENEILMGDFDKHLYFKLSFILSKIENKYTLTVTTVVVFNNFLGFLYFIPVKPFHKLIVKKMILRIIRRIQK